MTNTVSRLLAIILAGVVAVAAFGLFTFQAEAWDKDGYKGSDGDRTEIEVENEDTKVSNHVSITANTGGNSANGGDSGQGGPSMPPFPGGLKVFPPMPGGGDAGPGGDGGKIVTGAANAYGTLYNDANSNYVVVEGCGCDDPIGHPYMMFFGSDGERIEVEAENEDTKVRNHLEIRANTGLNSANGGDGLGEESSFNPWMIFFRHMQQDEGGGDAGIIRTGNARAEGHITNYANTNVVRILNGEEPVVVID
jgi:hypothetical protein